MKIKLFGRTIELRLSAETDSQNPAPWLYDALGAVSTSTGVNVNENTALQFSAVYACVNVIKDQIASFPKGIYRRINDRERKYDFDHPCQKLIDSEPNEFYTAFDLWGAITASVLLYGNGFAKIVRDDTFNIIALEVQHPATITILYGLVEGKVVLAYKDTTTNEIIPPYDMLHFKGLNFDGVQGQGVIRAFAKESIGLSIAAEKFGAKFFGNDTIMTKYLTFPNHLSENAIKNLTNSWQTANAGLDNAFKLKVLEDGGELKTIGIPPEQAQFLGTRQHQIEEICRWFKVQPHLIQHLLRSTNNNIEHQGIEFVTQTLTPWVVSFEQELNRKLFTTLEKKKGRYVKFNMNSLIRGDVNARTQHYTQMIQWGVYSPNEVRELEDRNPREGGDTYLQPLNMTGNDKKLEENEDKEDDRANPVTAGERQGKQDG